LPRLGAPSTHVWVKSEGVGRTSQAQNITPFTISGKGSHYPTNSRVQKDMSNKSDIYRKHMRNNKIYMCQYEAIRCQHKHSQFAFG
ncbi:hypothetical protein BHE74_00029093, partial [Ensete ventricosum]